MMHKALFIFTIVFLIFLGRTANAVDSGQNPNNTFSNAFNSPAFATCAQKLGINGSTNLYDPAFEAKLQGCIVQVEAQYKGNSAQIQH